MVRKWLHICTLFFFSALNSTFHLHFSCLFAALHSFTPDAMTVLSQRLCGNIFPLLFYCHCLHVIILKTFAVSMSILSSLSLFLHFFFLFWPWQQCSNNQCGRVEQILLRTILFVWEKHYGEEDTQCSSSETPTAFLLCLSLFSYFFSALELLCDISCGPNNKSSSVWTCLKFVCTTETL